MSSIKDVLPKSIIKVVGITGGIACGKSTITKLLVKEGLPVIDADQVARDIVVKGTVGLQLLVDAFGKEILTQDGSLDRGLLGSIVFSDKEKMKILNSIMLPLIESHVTFATNVYKNAGHKLIFYDAALIIETGNADKYRPLIVIHCDEDKQIERIIKRNSLSETEARRRIAAQMSTKEKLKFADYVVDTNRTLEESAEQAIKIIVEIKKDYL